jgi:hypothetical protein
MRKIRFKRIRETEKLIQTYASVPIAKGVYLSRWLINDNRKEIRVIPPFIYYMEKGSRKAKHETLLYFDKKDLKNRWLKKIRNAYKEWRDEENSIGALNNKVKLLQGLFIGRKDVFAKYWESSKGRKGYQPACKNEWKKGICYKPCSRCENREYPPLTTDIYEAHLKGRNLQGKLFVVGIYPLLEDNTSYFIAVDFDGENALQQAKEFVEACSWHGVPAYIERSRSGIGCHVWIFFTDKIPAWKSRSVILKILKGQNLENGRAEGFDRLFPNQDRLTGRGLGNLIALPLQGQSVQKGYTVFLDPRNQFKPYRDQWEFLKGIERIGEEEFDELIEM